MRGDNDQLASFWMPFTANRAYKANPRQLVSASGMHYQSADGRTILDGTAGLWCCNAGHCRPEIADAIRDIFNVRVAKVNTLNRKGKRKRNRKNFTFGQRPNTKRAIVTLVGDDRIDLFEG